MAVREARNAQMRAPGWRGQGFQSDADNHSDLARTRFRGSRTRSRSPLPGCWAITWRVAFRSF